MKRNKKKWILTAFAASLLSSYISAAIPDFFRGNAGIFTLNPVYDGIIGGGGIALNAGILLFDHFNGFPEYDGNKPSLSDVNPVDRWGAQPYSKTLHITGTVTEAFAMAVPLVFVAADSSEWGVIAVMYAESMLWANGIKETVKTFVTRQRPYMYFDGAPSDKIESGDYIRSFPSGHTTMAFNGAVFTSYVFSKYFPDSPWKIPVIAGSMTLAAATAVQRVLSGNHFITDVCTGAVLGSLTGFLVPFLHTLPENNLPFQTAVSPTGFYIRYEY